MEELPRSFENTGSDTESRSEKKSEKKKADSSSVRAIGAFAKMTAESTPVPVDRTEARKSFFEEKDTEKKDSSDSKKEAPEAIETKPEADETTRKVEALQEELTARIEGHQEVIDSTPEDSTEHVEAVAAKNLDEGVKEKATNPDIEANPVIEAEFARQLEAIELPEETDSSVSDEYAAETSSVEDTEDEPEDTEDGASATQPTATSPTTNTSPPKKNPPTQPAGSGGSAMPPVPPVPPVRPPTPPPLPPLPPSNGGNVPHSPNVAPNSAPVVNPNAAPDSRNERQRRRVNPAASALVGYAIGRRSGRKRAERRYEPKLASLTQELDITKKHLEAREIDLKKAAANSLREQQAEKYARQQPERAEQLKKKPVTEILRQTVMAPEKIHSAITPAERETTALQPLRPETSKVEVKPQQQPTPEAATKRAEQLSTPALLKAAESLIIEGVSVRRMYETNKIDRNGLVAIVQEGLKGGNIVHAFEKVELGAEAQAGRAREFRHDDPSFGALSSNDTTTDAHPQSASTQLPNNPDLASLQPINIPTEHSTPETPEPTQPEDTTTQKKPLLDPKTAEFKFAAIAAIAIALLVLWAIL